MKLKFIGIIAILVILMIPYNTFLFVDKNETIVLTRIQRKSLILGNLGVFYTSGKYENRFMLPKSYVNPHFIDSPTGQSNYEIYAVIESESVSIYNMTYCESKGLNDYFKLIDYRSTAYSFNDIINDKSGRFMLLP